ncbi:MAG: NAD-dependent protein deacylase [Lachnospiraceae bacterium]|nr:NAD-dependent protein deacylase [Lachnospiraceae bacterium]
MEGLETLKQWVDESNNIVFFGGAGVSTESGIPDFRSVDGLYHQKYDYPPETILSHTFFMRKTSDFYKFYEDKLLLEGAKPNAAHLKLAEWEKEGKLKAVITQNIDGLHQLAGSKEVLELHGSVQRNYCMRCGAFYDFAAIKEKVGESKKNSEPGSADYLVPKCDKCGGIIKPDVVLYEEGLDDDVISKSIRYISNADVLIIGGTSLVVYPAAGLIHYYRGKKLVLVNLGATPQDDVANLIVRGKIGEVFSQL